MPRLTAVRLAYPERQWWSDMNQYLRFCRQPKSQNTGRYLGLGPQVWYYPASTKAFYIFEDRTIHTGPRIGLHADDKMGGDGAPFVCKFGRGPELKGPSVAVHGCGALQINPKKKRDRDFVLGKKFSGQPAE